MSAWAVCSRLGLRAESEERHWQTSESMTASGPDLSHNHLSVSFLGVSPFRETQGPMVDARLDFLYRDASAMEKLDEVDD